MLSCPFCGSEIPDNVDYPCHPTHASCSLSTYSFPKEQWAMRPNQEIQAIKEATNNQHLQDMRHIVQAVLNIKGMI